MTWSRQKEILGISCWELIIAFSSSRCNSLHQNFILYKLNRRPTSRSLVYTAWALSSGFLTYVTYYEISRRCFRTKFHFYKNWYQKTILKVWIERDNFAERQWAICNVIQEFLLLMDGFFTRTESWTSAIPECQSEPPSSQTSADDEWKDYRTVRFVYVCNNGAYFFRQSSLDIAS